MTAPTQELTPQAEEDIEIAQWITLQELLQNDRKLYGSIRDMLLIL